MGARRLPTTRTEDQLRDWCDRLTDTLPPNIVNPDQPGAVNRGAFLTLLRGQIPQLAIDPVRWQHAKSAVRAFIGQQVAETVERLAAATGQPSRYAAA